jgi:hypothetical protein
MSEPPKRPAAHGVQLKSAVGVATTSIRIPAAHVEWSLQVVLPDWPWNCPLPHGVQLAAFATSEYLPAEQTTQRSGKTLVLSASCVPGLHGCFVSQNGWPVLSWYLPSGHAVQIRLVAFENSSTKQPVQVRSLLSLPAFATRWPAEHLVCAKQNVCPVSAWYLLATHCLHMSAFTSPEN